MTDSERILTIVIVLLTMKLTGKRKLSKSEWEHIIDEWIFNERDRKILKRKLLDGVHFEPLAEEFDLSVQQTKNIVYRSRDKLKTVRK